MCRIFGSALAINGQSSVLCCYVGMALQARDELAAARAMFDRAVTLTPSNTMARFKRASVTAAQGDYELALKQLEELRDALPKGSCCVCDLVRCDVERIDRRAQRRRSSSCSAKSIAVWADRRAPSL